MLKSILTIILTLALILPLGVEQYRALNSQIEDLQAQVQSVDTDLGSIKFVAGKVYKLSGSGIATTDTSIGLTSFKEPINSQELTMTDFGDVGYATLDPGSSSKQEFISFTGVTQDGSSDEATLTGVTRGLRFTYPYTASTSLRKSHSGGAKLILSNSPQFYNEMAIKRNDESIWGDWTFSSTNTPQYNSAPSFTSDLEIISKEYADDLAIAGAPDANLTTKGLVEIATISELISGANASTGDTSAYLIAPSYYYATTSNSTSSLVITDTDGYIDQGFIDLTESWTLTDDVTLSGTNFTVSASSSFATATFSVIPNLPASDPTTDNQAARKAYVDLRYIVLSSSTNLKASADAQAGYNDSSFAKYKEIIVRTGGIIRVGADVKASSSASCHYRVYVNGAAIGTDHETGETSFTTLIDSDIYVQPFDKVQGYFYEVDGNQYCTYRNFRLYWDETSTSTNYSIETN